MMTATATTPHDTTAHTTPPTVSFRGEPKIHVRAGTLVTCDGHWTPGSPGAGALTVEARGETLTVCTTPDGGFRVGVPTAGVYRDRIDVVAKVTNLEFPTASAKLVLLVVPDGAPNAPPDPPPGRGDRPRPREKPSTRTASTSRPRMLDKLGLRSARRSTHRLESRKVVAYPDAAGSHSALRSG